MTGRDSALISASSETMWRPRGRLSEGQPLESLTWFRVGGPAERLLVPADEEDLADSLPRFGGPVTAIGAGSNLLVRDGGIRGLAVRLGRGFSAIEELDGARIRAGAFVPAKVLARKSAEAGIGGLSFLAGIPGTLGGLLAMNAGCHGGEMAAVVESVRAVRVDGRRETLDAAAMGFAYRHCAAAEGRVFVEAVLRGCPADPQTVAGEIESLLRRREETQPVRERTGGSTFRNPGGRPGAGSNSRADDESAWRLIEKAGCRGLRRGDAMVSDKHVNFLINRGEATASDIEMLAEEVRRRVLDQCGVKLEWEIRRVGESTARHG